MSCFSAAGSARCPGHGSSGLRIIIAQSIKAPFPGVLGFRLVSPGAYVTAGTPLVNLEKIDRLKVTFSVAEIGQGYAARRSGEVAYNIPVPIGLCWDAPLPCATDTLNIALRLRDPARGLAAGFARAK